jgi:hypothetical protein
MLSWAFIKDNPQLCVEDHRVLHSCFNIPNLFPYKSSCTFASSLRPMVEDLKNVTTFLPFSKDSFIIRDSPALFAFPTLSRVRFVTPLHHFFARGMQFFSRKNKKVVQFFFQFSSVYTP